MAPWSASLMRAAVSIKASRTVGKSNADRLIVLRTAAVAVCFWKDSARSRVRAFVLKRLCQVSRARLHFVEQANVLDRNHRLVGEGLGQLDLFVGERF